jgi:hypothetical protein
MGWQQRQRQRDPRNARGFDPPVRRRRLPQEVVDQRKEWDEKYVPAAAALADRHVDLIVARARASLTRIVDLHRSVADNTDIDLLLDTRPLAIWETSGHALSITFSLVDDIERGYVAASAATVRALTEACTLTLAMCSHDDDLIRRWLARKYVSPKQASLGKTTFLHETTRQHELNGFPIELDPDYQGHRAALAELGIDPEGAPADILHKVAGRVYGNQSEAAHATRSATESSVARNMRRFAYGRHPDPRLRLHAATHGAVNVCGAIIDVGAALGQLLGMETVGEIVLRACGEVDVAYHAADDALSQFTHEDE